MVGVDCGVLEQPAILDPAFTSYGLLPNPVSLRRALETYLKPATDYADGDIGLFTVNGRTHPMHLAMFSTFEGRDMLIQANALNRPPKVTEASYSASWPDWLDSVWRYPRIA
jgi:hypothetical protein